MHRAVGLSVFLLVLAACDRAVEPVTNLQPTRATSSARDDVSRENYWTDDDFVFFSVCMQEFIHVTGRTHVLLTTSVEGSKTTYEFHSNAANYRGVGLTSGNEYLFVLPYRDMGTFDSEPPFAFDVFIHSGQVTVVKGEGRTVRIHVMIEATFDGTTFTERIKEISFICPGASE